MNCTNPNLAAARQQLHELRQMADAIGSRLVVAEEAEASGERLLTTITTARLLCALVDLNEQLTAEADRLDDAVDGILEPGSVVAEQQPSGGLAP